MRLLCDLSEINHDLANSTIVAVTLVANPGILQGSGFAKVYGVIHSKYIGRADKQVALHCMKLHEAA